MDPTLEGAEETTKVVNESFLLVLIKWYSRSTQQMLLKLLNHYNSFQPVPALQGDVPKLPYDNDEMKARYERFKQLSGLFCGIPDSDTDSEDFEAESTGSDLDEWIEISKRIDNVSSDDSRDEEEDAGSTKSDSNLKILRYLGKPPPNDLEAQLYRCSACQKLFGEFDGLLGHIRKYHAGQGIDAAQKLKKDSDGKSPNGYGSKFSLYMLCMMTHVLNIISGSSCPEKSKFIADCVKCPASAIGRKTSAGNDKLSQRKVPITRPLKVSHCRRAKSNLKSDKSKTKKRKQKFRM